MLRPLIASLQISENHGLLKRFGTAEVLGIVSSAMSFKMEVNKDMGSSECCIDAGIDPSLPRQLPSLNPFKRRRSTVLQQDGKVVTATRVGTNFPGEVKKHRWTTKG